MKRLLLLLFLIGSITFISAQTSFVFNKSGVGCLKFGMRFSAIPRKCPNLYDRCVKSKREDDHDGDIYTDYHFYNGNELVAYTTDLNMPGGVHQITIYSSNIKTPEGIYPGMAIKELLTLKGLQKASPAQGFLLFKEFTLNYSMQDASDYAWDLIKRSSEEKMPTSAWFKEDAKIESITVFVYGR